MLKYPVAAFHLSNINRFKLVKGYATDETPKQFKHYPRRVIYLSIMTYLEVIKPHIIKGSIIGIDESNLQKYQFEIKVYNVVFGLNNISLLKHIV